MRTGDSLIKGVQRRLNERDGAVTSPTVSTRCQLHAFHWLAFSTNV